MLVEKRNFNLRKKWRILKGPKVIHKITIQISGQHAFIQKDNLKTTIKRTINYKIIEIVKDIIRQEKWIILNHKNHHNEFIFFNFPIHFTRGSINKSIFTILHRTTAQACQLKKMQPGHVLMQTINFVIMKNWRWMNAQIIIIGMLNIH